MKTTRRDLFKFVGGSAVGALFTPAPWRLITDTALWSENWPGIPRPARGEIRAKYTNCSLCTAGCPVRAQCVGEQPVALAGVGGGLCPFGVTGHHLPYHPARLRQGAAQEAAAAVKQSLAKCGPGEHVAVLDLRPGRTASWTYRRAMAAVKNGIYLAPPQPSVAVNLANAKTVLSLGAPVLDGWGTPRSVFGKRDGFRLIQAEPVESHTASLADEWLAIRPGSEQALLLGIAGVRSIGETAANTGLAEEQIISLARELKSNGPALIVDREMSASVVALNVQLGGWGQTIGPRREAPVPDSWKNSAPVAEVAVVPDGSIRVLLIDESAAGEYLPWEAIEPKLVRDHPVVVAFAWSREGYGQHAHYVLPTAVYPEALDDVPPAVDSVAAFRISVPLVATPAAMVNPSEFVSTVGGLAAGDALRERADAVHKSGHGTVTTYADGKSAALKDMKADDFWKALNAGGAWMGDEEPAGVAPKVEIATTAAHTAGPLVVIAESRRSGLASPLMSKVYQESKLLLAPNGVALHPGDAASSGVTDGGRAILQTASGRWAVEVTVDSSVRPGCVLAGRPGLEGAQGKVVRA